ncbi:flagellar protein MotX [Alteromonas australica]|jgi:sodium-type polar flagellar protein MotX|uniref:Flagellar protein MotX n=1 Tax=Alteromonas australica TaxID=589873 RepID=A0A075PA37_9ALTE|nr:MULTISPECIES: tetratricopeptide repeat protein [Alteromonas]AIG00203.1 flagellar protein MotX [Alteromonas australica]AJP45166.1 flagellar protein MotX [Alteromonas australica]QPL50536.1 sel1 repeat family protein [Alteromonas sp. B31-7]HAI71906.1 sel1 repeat family protein [Alteromonas australica]HBF72957.1 sel1 repeat family protein [Alteromonas australica]|tara:strand:- start:389 stop:1036 length:648 start_codon:yes stop_codon:yes gene_type:complete
MKPFTLSTLFGLFCLVVHAPALAREGETLEEVLAVQLYSQDALIKMINENTHLDKVVADRCQLVQDIEARADVLKVPAYQFLWGDMLAWGVCVDAAPARGISYMEDAANQGLPAALEQLGRYYAKGTLVQQDKSRAVVYLREAAALKNLSAQMRLVELFLEGYGSPYDYQDAYHWLHHSVTDDKTQHQKIATYLARLEKLMHPKAVREAKRPADS